MGSGAEKRAGSGEVRYVAGTAPALLQSGLKCDVVFDQESLSRGGLMYW